MLGQEWRSPRGLRRFFGALRTNIDIFSRSFEETYIRGRYPMPRRVSRMSQSRVVLLCAIPFLLLDVSLKALADNKGDVAALEAQCEAQREEKIRPLREMEIEKCKAAQHNDAAYCERFWKDYGNTVRGANGVMVPRMFSELPVCVAALKARKALADDAR
jgi:hypothetical protein